LETSKEPDHPEHEEMLEWLGGDFAPAAFDVEGLNKAVRRGRYIDPLSDWVIGSLGD
jgi:hypothetical protein